MDTHVLIHCYLSDSSLDVTQIPLHTNTSKQTVITTPSKGPRSI